LYLEARETAAILVGRPAAHLDCALVHWVAIARALRGFVERLALIVAPEQMPTNDIPIGTDRWRESVLVPAIRGHVPVTILFLPRRARRGGVG
jgi:hypothetical protein